MKGLGGVQEEVSVERRPGSRNCGECGDYKGGTWLG